MDHLARHKVRREEAEQVFSNGAAVIEYQAADDEERWLIAGRSNAGRFLTVPWTFREDAVRVIPHGIRRKRRKPFIGLKKEVNEYAKAGGSQTQNRG